MEKLAAAILKRIQTRRKALYKRTQTGGNLAEIGPVQEELMDLQLWILERI